MLHRKFARTLMGVVFALSANTVLGEEAAKLQQPVVQKLSDITPTTNSTKITEDPTPARKVLIAPDAQKIIDDASAAYIKLKTLDLAGTITGEFEAAGQKQGGTVTFTASYESPNKFRHSAKDDVLAGSTGEKVYVYMKSTNAYLQDTAPKEKVNTKVLPKPVPRLISMQNPSLMLALAKDPGAELIENMISATKLDDLKLGDDLFPSLELTLTDHTVIVLSFDPATHFIRHATVDVRSMFEKQGIPDIRKTSYIVDYTATTANAPLKADVFAWVPPTGAKDIKDVKLAAGAESSPADALVGKDAPDFKLTGLDGKVVTSIDLKGRVIVLDFWATWCPPCRASLPHLDTLYQHQGDAGAKVFAINAQEEKDKVQAFVETTKLGLPVLLDSDGKTGGDYMVNGIPETVVIGKDGKVIKVFVGFNESLTPPELSKVVEEALKK